MTADTCGSASIPRKVAPPLKSTSTKLRSPGSWVSARPRTRVRSSSDLPEPVAPTIRPCGPMPPCADSLISSSTGLPSGSVPIGTRSRSRAERRRSAAGSGRRGSVMPSSPASVAVARASMPAPADAGRSGASCRAKPSAAARVMASGTPSPVPSSAVRLSAVTRSTRVRWPAAAGAPVTSSTTAPGIRSRALPGLSAMITWRGRPSPSWPRSPCTHRASGTISRTGPAASARVGCMVCGSHFAHSHSGIRVSSAYTVTSTSAGEWVTASWATTARARSWTAAGSPVNVIRSQSRIRMVAGSSGTTERARTRRSIAPVVSGSRSSADPGAPAASGSTSRSDGSPGPVPNLTSRKPAPPGTRSHTLRAATSAGRAAGGGQDRVLSSRCAPSAARTRVRT